MCIWCIVYSLRGSRAPSSSEGDGYDMASFLGERGIEGDET